MGQCGQAPTQDNITHFFEADLFNSSLDFYVSWTNNHDALSARVLEELRPLMPAFLRDKHTSLGGAQWFFAGQNTQARTLCGASPHLDRVGADASFHLQLHGTKKWFLQAASICGECEYGAQAAKEGVADERAPRDRWHRFEVHAGDFFAFDNDAWRHATALPAQQLEEGARAELSVSVEIQYFLEEE